MYNNCLITEGHEAEHDAANSSTQKNPREAQNVLINTLHQLLFVMNFNLYHFCVKQLHLYFDVVSDAQQIHH